MVEDGQGWIAGSGKNGVPDDGVRLFGVGITRAQRRLYLLGSLSAVRSATTGPLAAITEARRLGHVQLWSAARLLGIDTDAPTEETRSGYEDIRAELQQLAQITNITDEGTFYAELEAQLAAAECEIWMWSPWIATRAKKVTPLIRAAVDRQVAVTVFIRPDEDPLISKTWSQRELADLVATGATVIRSDHEHRKVVVIDRKLVLFGSLNPLSNSQARPTRESMFTMKGAVFAQRLLTVYRADQLGKVQLCGVCHQQMDVRRRGKARIWSWYCFGCKNLLTVPDPVVRR